MRLLPKLDQETSPSSAYRPARIRACGVPPAGDGWWSAVCGIALLLALSASAAQAAPGSLVIAGGALSPGNAAVHRAFLDLRMQGAPTIAVIPAASSEPAGSARRLAAALERHGGSPADVVLVHLATMDDPETPAVDESRWAGNATDSREIAKILSAGGIWFAGGDQSRITRSLLCENGADTPMLAAIRARLAAGAVIGGTSAGAAIMSRVMILNGDSRTALSQPVQPRLDPDESNTALVLGQGLGFLPDGLVDQHFSERDRLGRLTRALFEQPSAQRFGFGIDEDTALVVDLESGIAKALGSGTITVVDARAATAGTGLPFTASGVSVAKMPAGSEIALDGSRGIGLKPMPGPFPWKETAR